MTKGFEYAISHDLWFVAIRIGLVSLRGKGLYLKTLG